jgi:hypothetical protein
MFVWKQRTDDINHYSDDKNDDDDYEKRQKNETK